MNTSLFKKFLIIILTVTLFSACNIFDNENDEPKPEDKYLVSYELQKAYLPAFIRSVLDIAVKDYPEFNSVSDKVEHGISIYKISYITKFNGQEIIASGLVSMPNTKNVSFPLLSYQNGTNTLNSNAPSVQPDYELYMLLEFVASTGFVISMPDYLGFGESDEMFHPYYDKVSTVQSVVDMLRAVKELATNYLEIDISDDLFISGYSQGGWATMQLQKSIEDNFSSEFNLRASACGAGPYDLNTINKYIIGLDTYPMPYFIGYVFNSFYNLGITSLQPGDLFKSPYNERVLDLYDGSKSSTEINDQLTTKIGDLLTDNYTANCYTDAKYSSMVSSLTDNSIPAWKTITPTMILHGTADEFVPPIISNKMFQDFLSQGVGSDKVMLVPLQGATHTTGIIPSGIASINWFLSLKDN